MLISRKSYAFIIVFDLPAKKDSPISPFFHYARTQDSIIPLFFALTSFRSVPASGSPVSNIPIAQRSAAKFRYLFQKALYVNRKVI